MKFSKPLLLFLLLFSFFSNGQEAKPAKKSTTPEQNALLQSVIDKVYQADYIHAREEAIELLGRYPGDPLFKASVFGVLGDIEMATGNRKKALYYFRGIETIFRRNPEHLSRMCVIAWKYANLYYESKKYDSAYYYAQYAIDSSRVHLPSKYDGMLSANLPIIGYFHYLEGDYAAATRIYEEAIAVNARLHAESENVNTYLKMADLKAKQSDYSGAIAAAEQAHELAKQHHIKPYELAAVNKLVDLHREFGNFKEVAHYLQLKMDLLDEISLADQKKSLQELEAKFQSKLKEQENKSLKAINKKQQTENGFLLIIIVLSVVAVIAIFIFAAIFFAQKRRISRQKANVERLNTLNQKIFSVISHDFKGPMMGLDLLLGMQEKYKLDAERFTSQSNQLRNDLKQANLILENLLSWSRTELGMELSEKKCHPKDTAAIVIAQLQGLLSQKQLTVNCELPEDQTLAVASDSFTIILRNLLSNAIKYSHEGGEISIIYNRLTSEFAIRDNGIGMDQERQEQLFTRQLDSRLGTQRETGFGIGLNLVYELVRKNNGQIRVESKEGEGTTVYFSFNTRKTHGK